MMELDYERDTSIDMNNLDLEWNRQSRIFGAYAKELAQAELAVKKSHERVKQLRSELILESKSHPNKLPGGKATADASEAYYRTDQRYIDVKDEMINAEYERDVLQSAVSALNHKKVALENLVKLHGQSYFAGPSVPLEVGREWVKDTDERARQRRNNRRNK